MRMAQTKIWVIASLGLLLIGMPLVAQSKQTSLGIIVTGVDPDGPAAAAGIERGDLILGIDGQNTRNAGELIQALFETKWSKVKMRIKHGDDLRDQVVEIERIWGRPRIGMMIAIGAGGDLDSFLSGDEDRGRRAVELRRKPDVRRFRSEKLVRGMSGVIVKRVIFNSAAANAGIQSGDWITAVGEVPLDGSAERLAEIVGDYDPGDQMKIDYERDGDKMRALITLGKNPESGEAMLGILCMSPPLMFDNGDMRKPWHSTKSETELSVGGFVRTTDGIVKVVKVLPDKESFYGVVIMPSYKYMHKGDAYIYNEKETQVFAKGSNK